MIVCLDDVYRIIMDKYCARQEGLGIYSEPADEMGIFIEDIVEEMDMLPMDEVVEWFVKTIWMSNERA